MSYFIGEVISKTHEEHKNQSIEDLELTLSLTVLSEVLIERLTYTFFMYRQFNQKFEIIGTNNELIMSCIMAELNNLNVNYDLIRNYKVDEDLAVVEFLDENQEAYDEEKYHVDAYCKYMFVLKDDLLNNTDSEPVFFPNGTKVKTICNKKVLSIAISTDIYGNELPKPLNVNNEHYSTNYADDEHLKVSETMLAGNTVLEIIALNFNDNLYYYLQDKHDKLYKKALKLEEPVLEQVALEEKKSKESKNLKQLLIFLTVVIAAIAVFF
jgi:hypothetical protein